MQDFEKSPQYDLYRLTKKLNLNKDKLVPKNADSRCVKSTIINRAYYSSYSLSLYWLKYNFDFDPLPYWKFKNKKNIKSEHYQVRKSLYKHNKKYSSDKLRRLKLLRTKADYNMDVYLDEEEVEESLNIMNFIFDDLKFR